MVIGRRRLTASPWVLAWLAVVPFAIPRASLLAESDTFWQIRAGLTTWETGAIPTTDRFSWTVYDRAWRPNSWAFNVVAGLAYRAGGLTGVGVLSAALVMAVAAAVLVLAYRLGAPVLPAALVVLFGLPLATPWLQVRPHIVDYVAVPLLLVLCDSLAAKPRSGQRTGTRLAVIGCIGVIQLLWVNLHAAAPLGIAVVATAAVAAAAQRRAAGERPALGWSAAAVLAAVVGTAINPYGAEIFLQGIRVRAASADVIEWQPVRLTNPSDLALLVMAAVAVLVAWRQRRTLALAVLALFTIAGAATLRFLPVAAIVALAVLGCASQLPAVARWVATRRQLLRVAAAGIVAAFAATAALGATHLGRPDYPLELIDALPPGCRLFNSYDVGGPIILRRPDVPVSLDSRNDLYGPAQLRDLDRIQQGTSDGPTELRQLGVTCVLIPPGPGLASQLRRDPSWHETRSAADLILFLYAPTP